MLTWIIHEVFIEGRQGTVLTVPFRSAKGSRRVMQVNAGEGTGATA